MRQILKYLGNTRQVHGLGIFADLGGIRTGHHFVREIAHVLCFQMIGSNGRHHDRVVLIIQALLDATLITSPPPGSTTAFFPSGVSLKSAQILFGYTLVRSQSFAVAPLNIPGSLTRMFAPTGAVWSYFACTKASACAAVSSGADLQPAQHQSMKTHKNALKVFQFTCFSLFLPTYETSQNPIDPPFFSYFQALSMELHVTPSTVQRMSDQTPVNSACSLPTDVATISNHFPLTRFTEKIQKSLLVRLQANLGVRAPSTGFVSPLSSTSRRIGASPDTDRDGMCISHRNRIKQSRRRRQWFAPVHW